MPPRHRHLHRQAPYILWPSPCIIPFFFFNDTATTEIYTLSLHDALPIWGSQPRNGRSHAVGLQNGRPGQRHRDRKSTRLNSSHSQISYAVFCLKKKINASSPWTRPGPSPTLRLASADRFASDASRTLTAA